jgi:hypothetical protein
MNQNQATIIIVLLAAILFVLLNGRTAAAAFLDNLFWVGVAVGVLAIVAFAAKTIISTSLAERRARKVKELTEEIGQLCREIAQYPGPQLTSGGIPAHFPSKDAAQAFGERWSRGGPDSFSVKAVDRNERYEGLPGFDQSSICGGILFSYPALFFGMPEAHREDDAWWLEFLRAEERWLRDYSDHLKKPGDLISKYKADNR